MGFLAGATMADKIYWVSGCKLEIKNVNTWNSSITYLSKPIGMWIKDNNAVIRDNKIVFIRAEGDSRFDIYNISTNSWSLGVLPQTFPAASIISVNNTIYVTDGVQVWKLEF
jgi:hypothetical protein